MIYLILGIFLFFLIITKMLKDRENNSQFLSLKNTLILVILLIGITGIIIGINLYKKDLSKENLNQLNNNSTLLPELPENDNTKELEGSNDNTLQKQFYTNTQNTTTQSNTNTSSQSTISETNITNQNTTTESNTNTASQSIINQTNTTNQNTTTQSNTNTSSQSTINQTNTTNQNTTTQSNTNTSSQSTINQTNTTNQNTTTQSNTNTTNQNTTTQSNANTTPKQNEAIYFLNVGQNSDAFLLESNKKYGLIDTGGSFKSDSLIKELKQIGVNSLEFIIITHSHGDHIGGYEKVMNTFQVKNVYVKTEGIIYSTNFKKYQKIVDTAIEKKSSVCNIKLSKCQNIKLGSMKIRLYNTKFFTENNGITVNDNVNSVASLVKWNNRKVYFTGDLGNYAGLTQETRIAKKVRDIDIYKTAHHGYVKCNNNQTALNYLKAEYAIVTNPREKVQALEKRLKKSNNNYKKTYYTVEGTIKLTINKSGKILFQQ